METINSNTWGMQSFLNFVFYFIINSNDNSNIPHWECLDFKIRIIIKNVFINIYMRGKSDLMRFS